MATTGDANGDAGRTLEAIRYSRGSLQLLDQRKLPLTSVYIDIKTADDGWEAIKSMAVRGAPAIAIAGALSLAVELSAKPAEAFASASDAAAYIAERLDYLVTSRPTAVNLAEAAERLKSVTAAAAAGAEGAGGVVVEAYLNEVDRLVEEDVASNLAIGKFGVEALRAAAAAAAGPAVSQAGGKISVLTHCNTGSLATVKFGTALGVIRALFAGGHLAHAFCTETRPYNQGSRLTAYELVHDGIPATLIADSAAAYLMASGRVNAVVVGADRIAANGDTANKIGTYSLAVNCARHGVPFFVAAPVTTIDPAMASSSEIVIEQRPKEELTHTHGGLGERVAAEGIDVWNPSFDVTPAELITGIITDRGVARKTAGVFDLRAFLGLAPATAAAAVKAAEASVSPAAHAAVAAKAAAASAAAARPGGGEGGGEGGDAAGSGVRPTGVTVSGAGAQAEAAGRADEDGAAAAGGGVDGGGGDGGGGGAGAEAALDGSSVREFLGALPEVAARLGGVPDSWQTREVGDGNINFVYIVEGPSGALVLKQALGFIRIVGDAWPLKPIRSLYEVECLRRHRELSPEHVPEVYAYDRQRAIVAMRYVEPPHAILRKGFIDGVRYPLLADQVATYTANTMFYTSLLALNTNAHRSAVASFCGNVEMCRVTEEVIFTDPYVTAKNNRWTTPELDADAAALRVDWELKREVAALKEKFCEQSQALLHGDLHSGSIMATESSMFVIDAEFAFYGPIGFDVGLFLGNLLLAFFAQPGLGEGREAFAAWLLETVVSTWEGFAAKFRALWQQAKEAGKLGDLYPAVFFAEDADGELFARVSQSLLTELLQDSLGFAACEMIRRLVGIAHVAEMEAVQPAVRRAECERRAMRFARDLLVRRAAVTRIRDALPTA